MVISESEPRIGIMGGSFNPVHYGHLHVARDVKYRLRLDHMFLMPAAQSPLKAQHSVSASHRVAMLDRALEAFPELELDCREIDRAGPSFTVDSLSELREEFGNGAYLYFIVGDDCLPTLHRWRQWRDLTAYANLVVTKRPGQFPLPAKEVAEWYGETEVDLDTIDAMACGGLARVECSLVDISSTELREGLDGNGELEQVIPDSVIEYINHHQLYR